jgi:SAM-dependent methyltransferase
MTQAFAAINASKANFDDIYCESDPRKYFSVLGALDYMIPDVAGPVIHQLLSAKRRQSDSRPAVLDIGCSYGINAAVHRFPFSFRSLRDRYATGAMATVSSDELQRLDRNFYMGWPETGVARFVGLDAAAAAVRYALSVGLIEAGIVGNFESCRPGSRDVELLRRVDVVLSTGCVGYVTERTFRAILDSMDRPPWVISFVLRMFPYEPIAEELASRGLVTERLAGTTFVQRRFRDVDEFARCLAALEDRGLDTAGLESEGCFQAELFVSRPREEVRAAPLEDIVTVISGRNRAVGPRYVQVGTGANAQIALEP